MVLCSLDKTNHLQLWYRLLQQATISLNLIKKSITISHLSSYTHIFEEFDYNCTPLAPPGTRVVIHKRPNDRASWASHGEDGWYIGKSIEHYICHTSYINKTRAESIPDTVEFSPKQFNMPSMSSKDATFMTHMI